MHNNVLTCIEGASALCTLLGLLNSVDTLMSTGNVHNDGALGKLVNSVDTLMSTVQVIIMHNNGVLRKLLNSVDTLMSTVQVIIMYNNGVP